MDESGKILKTVNKDITKTVKFECPSNSCLELELKELKTNQCFILLKLRQKYNNSNETNFVKKFVILTLPIHLSKKTTNTQK